MQTTRGGGKYPVPAFSVVRWMDREGDWTGFIGSFSICPTVKNHLDGGTLVDLELDQRGQFGKRGTDRVL